MSNRLTGRVLPTITCPDCAAVSSPTGTFRHVATCPLRLALIECGEADQAFFEDHPRATYFYRYLTDSEGWHLRLCGIFSGEGVTLVRVTSDGTRERFALAQTGGQNV
jgi:hypothetical protein